MGPLAVFVWFLAPQLVPLFGGDKWLGAVALVRILSWAALLRCMAHLVPQVLHAAGRPDLAVWDSLATLGSLAVAFLALTLVVPGLGSAAMAWGWLLAYPGLLLLLYVFARRAVPLRAGAWWLSLLPGILAMALSAAILFVVDALLPPGGAPWMRLALGAGGTLGAVILCARSGLAR
jgi:O-antigen/teichoic acid export membrane protein